MSSSGKQIESCYFCSLRCPRSSCYNIQIGYGTVFCCTIECATVINAYLYVYSHYKVFSYSNIDKAIDHFCYSKRCRASDYNLNVSQLKRLLGYYCTVRLGLTTKDSKHVDYLVTENRYGDIWSHDDPFDESFDDSFP